MLARAPLPARYEAWNRRWGAPFGRPWTAHLPRCLWSRPGGAALVGPFAFQINNDSRVFEYPWAYETLAPRPGQRVLEIGGSLAGLQFTLARAGCAVVNVDPGQDPDGVWPLSERLFGRLRRRFGATVELRKCLIEAAGLEDASFDHAICISVIEHLDRPAIMSVLAHVRRALRPGGTFVMTLDLFPDLVPFTMTPRNRWGENVSVQWLVEASGLTLRDGDPHELCGYAEFDPVKILADRDRYFWGTRAPTLTQLLVLQKPTPRAE